MHNRSEEYGDKRSRRSGKTKGVANNPSFNAKVGAAARIHFQKETGKKAKTKTSIIDSKEGGPRFGKLYLLKWTTPGYGPPKTEWCALDKVSTWPDLLESYRKARLTLTNRKPKLNFNARSLAVVLPKGSN